MAQSSADPCSELPALSEHNATARAASEASSTGQPAPPAAQVAQQYLRCALRHFTQQDYRQAIRYFDLAHRAAPSADLQYNIARSHELLNEYDEAASAYERYLRDKVNAPDRAEVEQRVQQLRDLARRRRESERQRDGRALLSITVDQPGARVSLDDRLVGVSPIPPGLQLTPGPHRLTVELDGFQRWQAVVRARPGETGRAAVSLAEETRFRTRPAPHVASFALGGIGAAALIAGVALGVVALRTPLGPAPLSMTVPCTDPTGMTCAGPGGADAQLPTHVTSFDCANQELTCAREPLLLGSSIAIGAAVALFSGAAVAWFVEAGSGRTERVRGRSVTVAASAAR